MAVLPSPTLVRIIIIIFKFWLWNNLRIERKTLILNIGDPHSPTYPAPFCSPYLINEQFTSAQL